MDRRTYVGGADIASILGLQPKGRRTSLGTWEGKVADEPEAPETDKAKRKLYARGQVVEPLVANLLEVLHDVRVEVRNRRHVDPLVPFFAAEIDGEIPALAVADLFPGIDFEPFEVVNLEIKTVHPFAAKEWGEEGSEDVPIHYASQIYWGLGVTRRRLAICAALFGADDLVLYPIVADAPTIAAMRAKAAVWWQSYVVPKIAPPATDLGDLALLFPTADGSTVESDEAIHGACLTLAAMKNARKSYENGEEGVSFLIREFMKSATTLSLDGFELATLKTQSRKFIDEAKLKADYPDVYKACLSSTSYRVLRLKD